MGAAALQCSAVCRIVGKLGRHLKNFARSPNSVVPALTEGGTFKKPLEWGLVRALMIAISRGESAHISFSLFNLTSSIFLERIR